jgi:small subunit ribosomal protein S21
MSVELRPGESQEGLLKRFRKEVVKDRILSTYRKKRWFVSKSENRRLAKQRAIRKARRKAMAANRRQANA